MLLLLFSSLRDVNISDTWQSPLVECILTSPTGSISRQEASEHFLPSNRGSSRMLRWSQQFQDLCFRHGGRVVLWKISLPTPDNGNWVLGVLSLKPQGIYPSLSCPLVSQLVKASVQSHWEYQITNAFGIASWLAWNQGQNDWLRISYFSAKLLQRN